MAFFFSVFTFTTVPTVNFSALSPQSRVTIVSVIAVTLHFALAARMPVADVANRKIASVAAVISFFMVALLKLKVCAGASLKNEA